MTSTQIITHRGLEPSKPHFFSESSFEAFQDHLNRGFNIEFDPNPTKDGIIVMHDANLKRPTESRDERNVADLTTEELLQIPLANGRIPTFDEVMDLIRKSNSTVNALHMKARFQSPETLEKIMEALAKHSDIFGKLLIFDVKPETAKVLKSKFPTLRLAPSVAHPYDIQRYNDVVGNTLITVEEALKLASEGLIDGVWGDEWDTAGENGTTKQFYTPENFARLHEAGLFIALVTPELHGTSPGLYGGESHADAKDLPTLFERIKQIKEAGADYFCTDYPEEVAKL
ncbi:MAG: hypothetical protein G01um10145_898 [Microgenomates group bacterium Gr01-1014_5]|nr:MAG: hypothetical protein G01um10145_898 [Microgenomates group bacterium Gr01-1014_5]